jgi:hypothetical protein
MEQVMGIEYTILFNSPLDISGTASLLRDNLGYSDYSGEQQYSKALVPVKFLSSRDAILCITLLDKHSREMYLDSGVQVTMACRCQMLDSFVTNGVGSDLLIDTIHFIANATSADLLFLFNYDLVLLLRNHSGLFINRQVGFWSESNKARLGMQFTEVDYRPL